MGSDAWQRLSAHVAEGRSGVRAGVPVVHPAEVVHAVLGGLRETDAESAARTGPPTDGHTDYNNTDLIVLSVLDAAQRRHPLLHLLPVVGTQNQTSAGGDNLHIRTHTKNTDTGGEGVYGTVFTGCFTVNAAGVLQVHCSLNLKKTYIKTQQECVYVRVRAHKVLSV